MSARADAGAPGRSRPDVAARIAHNKTVELVTRVQSLRQFSRPTAGALSWEDSLHAMDQAEGEAYLLSLLYTMLQLKHQRTIAKMDQDFFQRCLSLVTNTRRSEKTLREQYEKKMVDIVTRDRNRRWRAAGRVGRMHDYPIDTPIFAEEDFQSWVDRKKFNMHLCEAAHLLFQLRGASPVADTKYLASAWFQTTALRMATNAQNNFVANFARRMRDYIMQKRGVNAKEARQVLDGVFAVTYDGRDPDVVKLRHDLKRGPRGKVSWKPNEMLPLYSEFLQYAETENKTHNKEEDYEFKSLFALLPTKQGFTASYHKIDSTGLRGLLLRSPDVDRSMTVKVQGRSWTLEESLQKAHWSKTADKWWRRLFNVARFEKRGLRFRNQIVTDGYGVGVVLEKKKKAKTRRPRAPRSCRPALAQPRRTTNVLGPTLASVPRGTLADYDDVWAVDPGQIDLFSAVSVRGERKDLRTSTYRAGSGFYKSAARIRREIHGDKSVKYLLSKVPSKKTVSVKTFKTYLQFWFKHGKELLVFFRRRIFRKLRFRRFAQKNSYLDRAADQLAGVQNPKQETFLNVGRRRNVLGYGDCGAAHGSIIKKWPRAPVKTFARKLARRCEVVVVNEYRTSKVHYNCTCETDLTNQKTVRVCRGKPRNVNVHRVLHCRQRDRGCGRTVNRDANAAQNILSVLTNQLEGAFTRPPRLAFRPEA